MELDLGLAEGSLEIDNTQTLATAQDDRRIY